MRIYKRYNLSTFSIARLMDALAAVDQMLEDLFQAVFKMTFGRPVHQTRCENFDGSWLVVQFTAAATDTTVLHRLGRVPMALLQVEPLPSPGEVPVPGQVTLISATADDVTLRCTSATKQARIILF